MTQINFEPHAIVSREQWLAARRRHLAREKELMRQYDQLAAERRGCPGCASRRIMSSTVPAGR